MTGALARVFPALFVVFVWGVNFSAIAQAEDAFPPMLLAFLRFILCVVPIIFFVKRPRVETRWIVAYGILFGLLQFVFLFAGMSQGTGPGSAAFLLQSQAFFTILLSFFLLQERIHGYQTAGLILGAAGIAMVLIVGSEGVSFMGGLLVIAAGLAWGAANLVVKVAKPDNVFSFVVYASAVAVLPLLVLTLVVDGPHEIWSSMRGASLPAYASLGYLVYPTTLAGYAVWNRLLSNHPAIRVAPFALLIPIVGAITAFFWRGESVNGPQALGFAAIFLGLAVSQFWPIIGRVFSVGYRKERERVSST